jgi:hypothetical protein
MRVGVDRNKYQIQIPLPPKIDPSVTMMTVRPPQRTYPCCADLVKAGPLEQLLLQPGCRKPLAAAAAPP